MFDLRIEAMRTLDRTEREVYPSTICPDPIAYALIAIVAIYWLAGEDLQAR